MNNTLGSTIPEKWYPKTFDDIMLPTAVRKRIMDVIDKKSFRLLLHSTPGTGKTTISRLLSENFKTMYLSGSNDFNIDKVREKIQPFASGMSFDGKRKLIIIDEADRIRADLQDSFKVTLDQMQDVSFIFITNHFEKIIDAIKSRCSKEDFNFSGEDLLEQQRNWYRFTANVCDTEGIQYRFPNEETGKDNMDGLQLLFRVKYPDFRDTLITLESIKVGGGILNIEAVNAMFASGKQDTGLYEIITNGQIQGKELYEKLSVYRGKEYDVLESLGSPFFAHLNNLNMYDHTLQVAIIVSKYCELYISCIDKFTCMLACCAELKSKFR